MAFQNITMNISALQNINPPNITTVDSLTEIIVEANNITNDYIIFAIMGLILFVCYWLLSDKSINTDFGYDDLRALNIGLAISTIFGLTLISVGWSGNFIAVGMFAVIFLGTYISILIYNNIE